MAYSSGAQIIPIQLGGHAGMITVAATGIDVSDASADAATMFCPLPLLIYQFGLFVTESPAASGTGSIFLESSTVIVGSDTAICEIDFDSTDLQSGDGDLPNVTASAGSESIDNGDVIWGPKSDFPWLVQAGLTLTVRHVQTAIVGELAPFIYAKWLPMDVRRAATWVNVA